MKYIKLNGKKFPAKDVFFNTVGDSKIYTGSEPDQEWMQIPFLKDKLYPIIEKIGLSFKDNILDLDLVLSIITTIKNETENK